MKRRSVFSCASVVVLPFLLLTAASFAPGAQAVEIRVNAEAIEQPVSPLLFGNSVIYGGDIMGFNKWVSTQEQYESARSVWNSYLPYIVEMGPTVLRYPHGLGANNFYWKDGIGPITKRNRNYDGTGIPQTFGTDEFLQYAEELGAEAILVVNVSVAGKRPGSVQDAADWVEYCNAPADGSNPNGGTDWAALRAANGHKEPYGVKYWELGNEETFPGWSDYARRVREYSAAMKAVDPTIQVGVIATGTGLDSEWQREDWLRYHTFMLENAGSAFDFWIYHTHLPAASGDLGGLSFVQDGAAVETDFELPTASEYRFQIQAESRCRSGQCPSLTLQVDGERVGSWRSSGFLDLFTSDPIRLSKGSHRARLACESPQGANLIVPPQIQAVDSQGKSVYVDLRNSLEWYQALQSASNAMDEGLKASRSYTGRKPVFVTEMNVNYKDAKSPPFLSKASALREMLSLASIYHVMIQSGIALANYWLLFQESDGIGVLEGVAYDAETRELGRPDPRKRPVFHLLKMYRSNMYDNIVTTKVQGSPTFSAGPKTGVVLGYVNDDYETPYVQALASLSAKEDRLSLFVINLDPERDYEIPVRVDGFPFKQKVRVQTITGPSPASENEPESCAALSGDCVKTQERVVSVSGSPFSYSFPRHSVTVLLFEKTGIDTTAPKAPTGLVGAAGDGVVSLFWQASQDSDVAGYNIYRSRAQGGPFAHRVNSAPVRRTDFLDETVDNDVAYTYAVRAVDRSGNESPLSNRVVLTPGTGQKPPVVPPPDNPDREPPSPPFLRSVQ